MRRRPDFDATGAARGRGEDLWLRGCKGGGRIRGEAATATCSGGREEDFILGLCFADQLLPSPKAVGCENKGYREGREGLQAHQG